MKDKMREIFSLVQGFAIVAILLGLLVHHMMPLFAADPIGMTVLTVTGLALGATYVRWQTLRLVRRA
jgi:hypothetical protein